MYNWAIISAMIGVIFMVISINFIANDYKLIKVSSSPFKTALPNILIFCFSLGWFIQAVMILFSIQGQVITGV